MTTQAADASIAETTKELKIDSRLRIAGEGNRHFVSICGDNFAGPFKTPDAAITYGNNWLRLLDEGSAGATP